MKIITTEQIKGIKSNLPEVVSQELHDALKAWYAWDGETDEFNQMGLCNQRNKQLYLNRGELKAALPHNLNSSTMVTKDFPFNTSFDHYVEEKALKETHKNPYRRFWVECMLELPIA